MATTTNLKLLRKKLRQLENKHELAEIVSDAHKRVVAGCHLKKFSAHYWVRVYRVEGADFVGYALAFAWRNMHGKEEVFVGRLETKPEDCFDRALAKIKEMSGDRGYVPLGEGWWTEEGRTAAEGAVEDEEAPPRKRMPERKPQTLRGSVKRRGEDADW